MERKEGHARKCGGVELRERELIWHAGGKEGKDAILISKKPVLGSMKPPWHWKQERQRCKTARSLIRRRAAFWGHGFTKARAYGSVNARRKRNANALRCTGVET